MVLFGGENMRKRAVWLYGLVSLCLLLLTVRIIDITAEEYSAAGSENRKKTIEIGSTRGKIYDRNLEPLVDCEEKLIAAFTPSVKSKQILSRLLGEERANEIIESKRPYVTEVKEKVNDENIKTFFVPIRYPSSAVACHLVGYVNERSGNGASGIERGYNDFLKESSGTLSVSFSVDATGSVLQGLQKTINDENYNSNAGVVLTIDRRIQKIAENALEKSSIKSGCAIVMHVQNGEILALASVPKYDRNNIGNELEKKNSPLSNKALPAYSVGSVFKSVVAAYALECGIGEETEFYCPGSITVGDTVFSCYHSKAHKNQTMAQALQNSCNIYFIKLIEKLDTDGLLMFCRSIGLSHETKIAEGVTGEKGCLPSEDSLRFPGERANFSFGQGKLLISPLQMLGVYHALATGYYVKPTAIFGFSNEEKLVKKEKVQNKKRVLSESTVKTVRKLLSSVVEKGNAEKAKSALISLAGKTGTAQSGIFDGKREICRTWFSGFFPAVNPHYIVVVLNEDGEGGSVDCAPVFKEICENIVRLG